MYLINETTGKTSVFSRPQTGWREATQEEIDAYLLDQAKTAKLDELKSALSEYELGGYGYGDDTYDISRDGLFNINLVDGLNASDPNAYTFRDTSGAIHDFENAEAWLAFKTAMTTERNRIMVYYVGKKKEINESADPAAVTVDFSA